MPYSHTYATTCARTLTTSQGHCRHSAKGLFNEHWFKLVLAVAIEDLARILVA